MDEPKQIHSKNDVIVKASDFVVEHSKYDHFA